ncbi:MAG: hypothetical protein GY713_11605 [Actinomycetia bacterium]|nr:hypothetical protein [Actinomycetes bacterium]
MGVGEGAMCRAIQLYGAVAALRADSAPVGENHFDVMSPGLVCGRLVEVSGDSNGCDSHTDRDGCHDHDRCRPWGDHGGECSGSEQGAGDEPGPDRQYRVRVGFWGLVVGPAVGAGWWF